jgi:hypothetical protein
MKRKIQHDAVNNQEDEDSSAYPTNFRSDEAFDKRKSIENSTVHFFSEASNNKDYLTSKHKYSDNFVRNK